MVIPPQHDASADSKGLGEPFEDYLRFTNKLTYSAVRTYRIISSVSPSFYESYTPGHLLDLRSHLVPWAEHLLLLRYYVARTSSHTASTWWVCGTQKVQ